MTLPTFQVSLAITRYMTVAIQAADEDEAQALAEQLFDEDGDDAFKLTDGDMRWSATETE